jgi:hypothetical protein
MMFLFLTPLFCAFATYLMAMLESLEGNTLRTLRHWSMLFCCPRLF